MTATGAAAVSPIPGLAVMARISAVRAGGGVFIVIRKPEQSSVISRLVLGRVVDVDIDHVACERIGELEPARVAGTEILQERTVNEIVLIIVMGNHRRWSRVIRGLVIGVDLAEIAPTI